MSANAFKKWFSERGTIGTQRNEVRRKEVEKDIWYLPMNLFEGLDDLTLIPGFYFFLPLLFLLVLPVLAGTFGDSPDSFFYDWFLLFQGIDPFFFCVLGIVLCSGLSIWGSTHGIGNVGTVLMGSAVLCPRVKSKNLVSVVFCEAIGVYGVILSFILLLRLSFQVEAKDGMIFSFAGNYQLITNGYAMFGSGACVGLGCFIAGISIGLVGGGTVIADSADPRSFVQMIIVEIFLEAIGIFSLVIGIIFQFKVDFAVSPLFK